MENKLIEEYTVELEEPECVPGVAIYSARVRIEDDVSAVMPYLNATLPRAQYGGDNTYIMWKEGDRKLALRPHELAISLIFDREQALDLTKEFVSKINEIWGRRGEITPSHEEWMPPGPLEVYKLLPKTNCRECGLSTCLAFAAGLIGGNKCIEDCPELVREESSDEAESLRKLGL